MAIKEFTPSKQESKAFWENWWSSHDIDDLVRGMKYYDEYPYCQDWLTKDMIILDAGCGQGLAFVLLEQHFQPKAIIGVDIDKEEISLAPESAKRCKGEVKIENSTVCNLNIPDSSIDMIFCHQLIHHICHQSTKPV